MKMIVLFLSLILSSLFPQAPRQTASVAGAADLEVMHCVRVISDTASVRYEAKPEADSMGVLFQSDVVELRRASGSWSFVYGMGFDLKYRAKANMSGWVLSDEIAPTNCPGDSDE